MKYLVMECHPGYAVVLDQQGQFLRVANQNFEVGQQVESVVAMLPAEKAAPSRSVWRNLVAVAACLCLLLAGAWMSLLMPYGAVRIKINPDVKITVNLLDRVIKVEPLNQDAVTLLYGYDPRMQKVDRVADELADRAREMGFLREGGQIQVTVESTHGSWKVTTQDRLILELETHNSQQIVVIPNPDPIPEAEKSHDAPVIPQLTVADAKNLALRHLGITEADIHDYEYDLDGRIYEIDFHVGNVEYEFEIDAVTGEIVKMEQEKPDEPKDPDDDDIEDDDDGIDDDDTVADDDDIEDDDIDDEDDPEDEDDLEDDDDPEDDDPSDCTDAA